MTKPSAPAKSGAGEVYFDELATKWPSAWVARNDVGKFSGGLLNPKTLANLDSCGKGIPNRFRVGRLVAYRANDLINWLKSRTESIGSREVKP